MNFSRYTWDYLVAFPRSGVSAVRLFLERYADLPTSSTGNDNSRILLSLEQITPFVIKSHKFDMSSTDRVIFLLRDYNDCIPSFMHFDPQIHKIFINRESEYELFEETFCSLLFSTPFGIPQSYAQLIKLFHTLLNKNLLIYYEDFVSDFENTAKRIIKFLDLDLDEEKLRKANVVNKEGRAVVDNWFLRRNKLNINKGCTNFVGEYGSLLRNPIDVQKRLRLYLGDEIYTKYLKRYEVIPC